MYQTLRKTLSEQSLSVNKLSLMAGVTASSLYAALSGNIPLYAGWRRKIADALGVSENELFPEGEEVRHGE